MRSITELLLNHPIPGIREAETRHRCAETLSKLLGVAIAPSQVKFDAGKLSLSIPPILKSVLILKRTELGQSLAQAGIDLKEVR